MKNLSFKLLIFFLLLSTATLAQQSNNSNLIDSDSLLISFRQPKSKTFFEP